MVKKSWPWPWHPRFCPCSMVKLTKFDHLTTVILEFWLCSWSKNGHFWPFDHGNFEILAMVMVKNFLTIWPWHPDVGQMVKKSWSSYPPLNHQPCSRICTRINTITRVLIISLGDVQLRLHGGGGANGEMANSPSPFFAIFRHFSPFFAIGPPPPPPPITLNTCVLHVMML